MMIFFVQSSHISATSFTNTTPQNDLLKDAQSESSISNLTEQIESQKSSWATFLQDNQLLQSPDGKLYTTGPSNYIQTPIDPQLNIERNPLENQIVVVDPTIHIADIDIRLSNGAREYGWYGKRVNGEIALCIEQGAVLNIGENGGYSSSIQVTELLKKISLIKYYGVISTGYTMQKELLTQLLTWEQQGITPVSISGEFTLADYQSFKTTVMNQVNLFYTQPSFHGQMMTLNVGESQTYVDTTGAFANYIATPTESGEGLIIEKQGEKVTVTATKEAPEISRIEFKYNIPNTYQGAIVVYQHAYTQNMMVGRVPELTKTSFTIHVQKEGNARIRKVDQTTKQPLVGAVFRFTTSDGQTKELTTGSDGYATWNDLLVDTEVTIQEIQAPDGYILNSNPQTIIIKANETTTITLDNQQQLANLTVIKEDEETGSQPQGAAHLVGAVYELRDADGKVVGRLTMEEMNGTIQAELKGLKLGSYVLQEVEPPEGYNLDPTTYPVDLTYAGQNETVALHNKTVTDRVIKGYVEGYKFGSRPLIPTKMTEVLETLTKSTRESKPPLVGVELTATSHTTGQEYLQVTGENGYFKFEGLPYDTYTIAETKGVDGYLLIEPFDVTITEEGYTHFFLLEDKVIESRLHIIKVDEETGETIPYAGAQFKIFDTWANEGDGGFISMSRPNDTENTDIFETNEKGEIVTTESLPWGVDRYELHEIKAPEGYLPLEKPLIFSVTQEDADALIRLEVPNRLARQSVSLIKRDRLNEQLLENVAFGLYKIETNEQGEQSEVWINEYRTDKEGKILVENLPYGKYKFMENEPLEGYLPLENTLDFSVTAEKDGELIVLEAYNERETLELTSRFTDINGNKELDPSIDNQLKDTVWVKGKALEIEHTYTVVTQYKHSKTGEVVSEKHSTFTAKSKEDQFEVTFDLKANTLKEGDQLTATHVLYYEEARENEVAREDDLTNKEQTLSFVKPNLPLIQEQPQKMLPKTGNNQSTNFMMLGSLILFLHGVILYKHKRRKI